MPRFHTNKVILKAKFKCPNPRCEMHHDVQVATAFTVRVLGNRQQVIDHTCDSCHEQIRLELN
jgi:aspartate carbamoyltransferase regulatory subunit